MAADQTHAMGLLYLGYCYQDGEAVEKNEKEAFRCIKYIF